MICSDDSPWNEILSSATVQEALARALKVDKKLRSIPLPRTFDELGERQKEYARAVQRMLNLKIDGIPRSDWELWKPTDSDKRLMEKWQYSGNRNKKKRRSSVHEKTTKGNNRSLENSDAESLHEEKSKEMESKPSALAPSSEIKENTERETTGLEPVPVNKSGEIRDPTSEELKAADAVKQWALISPHTDPPFHFVRVVRESVIASRLIFLIVPNDSPQGLRAAAISAFAKDATTSLVRHIVTILINPYLKQLQSPAPRDIMQAIVEFSEQHWRGAVLIYEDISKSNDRIIGSLAEVLVRIANVLTSEGAMKALQSLCARIWGEDGVRVVEALIGKCATEENLPSFLVPALGKNITGSEKSVRFGKLLFKIVKDVPAVSDSYADAMESIVLRSQVFLAKRALAVLKSKK